MRNKDKEIISKLNDLSLFTVLEDDAKYVFIPEIRTLIAEYLCSNELADIIEALDGSLRLLMEMKESESFSPRLLKFSEYLKIFLREMNVYARKKILFHNRIFAEVELLASLTQHPKYFIEKNPDLKNMVNCLIGNLNSISVVPWMMTPDNLIREIRGFHWNGFIDRSLNERFLECKRIIFHSLTLIGLVTVEMNDSFLRCLFEKIELVFNNYSIEAFRRFTQPRFETVDKDQKDSVGALSLDGLDVKMSHMFRCNLDSNNVYGSMMSSSLGFSEDDRFMFAVTPFQFDKLEKAYNNHVEKHRCNYSKLKTEIIKLLNEYASLQEDLQEELKMPKEEKYEKEDASAGSRAIILRDVVRDCDSFESLKTLIPSAIDSYPLMCESFESIRKNIKNLIEEIERESPYCFFRQKEFKTIDSSFTSSSGSYSSSSSCASSSSSHTSSLSSSGSRKRKLDTLSSSGMFNSSCKRKLDLEKFRADAQRTKIKILLREIKKLQEASGEKFNLSSENQFKTLESCVNYLTAHKNRLLRIGDSSIWKIENQFKDFKISTSVEFSH